MGGRGASSGAGGSSSGNSVGARPQGFAERAMARRIARDAAAMRARGQHPYVANTRDGQVVRALPSARQVGDSVWVVHRNVVGASGWKISHGPSGLSLPGSFSTRSAATRAGTELARTHGNVGRGAHLSFNVQRGGQSTLVGTGLGSRSELAALASRYREITAPMEGRGFV